MIYMLWQNLVSVFPFNLTQNRIACAKFLSLICSDLTALELILLFHLILSTFANSCHTFNKQKLWEEEYTVLWLHVSIFASLLLNETNTKLKYKGNVLCMFQPFRTFASNTFKCLSPGEVSPQWTQRKYNLAAKIFEWKQKTDRCLHCIDCCSQIICFCLDKPSFARWDKRHHYEHVGKSPQMVKISIFTVKKQDIYLQRAS